MRKLEPTTQFKKDYKRELKGRYRLILETELSDVIKSLAKDNPLATRYRDHALSGSWSDHRDCHIKPDLVLIYRKPDPRRLQVVRLGSHSELNL